MFPVNSTGLSIAGALKWFLIIGGIPLAFKAFQGIVMRATATGNARSVGTPLTGREAQVEGWLALGMLAVVWGLAWAIWYFWQRNED